MKRTICALLAILLLTACAAKPQEIPLEIAEPAILEPGTPTPAETSPAVENTAAIQDLPPESEPARAVTLCPGVAEALADGVLTPLPAAPFVENGIFYFPVEAVSELLGLDYARSGNAFCLSHWEYGIQLFLNSRLYVLEGQSNWRTHWRGCFAPGAASQPVGDEYVPVERDGVVFLPSDYLNDMEAFYPYTFFQVQAYPETGMVIFSQRFTEEPGIGSFYLKHKFDETPPEARAGLECVGRLDEYEGDYDIIGYAGGGLEVHVLRLRPDAEDTLLIDGTISAVLATGPEHPTPRGLRVGDPPRRAWELYGYEFADTFFYDYPEPNGPITAIGFFCLKEPTLNMTIPYAFGPPDEWFESPAFWES